MTDTATAERTTIVHYVDALSKDERDSIVAQYREEGYKSITVRERKDLAQGSGFRTAFEFEVGRKT